MLDLTLSTKGCKWTDIRVHGCKHLAGIVDFAAYIFRTIVPIESQGINRLAAVIGDVEKFHNSPEIVGFTRRLADKINVIYNMSAFIIF
jgi:hypothetical protein